MWKLVLIWKSLGSDISDVEKGPEISNVERGSELSDVEKDSDVEIGSEISYESWFST